MLGSTFDFLRELDATGLKPKPDAPPGICPECCRELCSCSGPAGRDRRFRYNAKRLGRCVGCGGESRPGLTQCQSCTDRQNAIRRARWKARKAAGLCARCPNKAEPGRTRCRWCSRAVSRKRGHKVQRARQPGTGAGSPWTPEEDALLRQAAETNRETGRIPGGRLAALAEELGRTFGAVRQRAAAIGAKSRSG